MTMRYGFVNIDNDVLCFHWVENQGTCAIVDMDGGFQFFQEEIVAVRCFTLRKDKQLSLREAPH